MEGLGNLVGTAPPVEHALVAVQLVGDCSSIDFHTRSENNQLKPLRHLVINNCNGDLVEIDIFFMKEMKLCNIHTTERKKST